MSSLQCEDDTLTSWTAVPRWPFLLNAVLFLFGPFCPLFPVESTVRGQMQDRGSLQADTPWDLPITAPGGWVGQHGESWLRLGGVGAEKRRGHLCACSALT